jgi:16S rRNA (cytosine967-C5)-methyltransferase
MVEHVLLDQALTAAFDSPIGRSLDGRDKAFARLLVVTVLRRHGELAAVLNHYLERPLAKQRTKVWLILLAGAAQLLLLDVKPHAAISLSVDLCRISPATRGFDRLINAVLRRTSETGSEVLSGLEGAVLNSPPWLTAALVETYGDGPARQIIEASLQEPGLDLSAKGDAKALADRLEGMLLPTGSVRLRSAGRIEELTGYADGDWWVQDAAAALPAQFFGAVDGKRVADLCSAPGGKTLQLAALGADVVSVDISKARLKRVHENLKRCGLQAKVEAQDVLTWQSETPFDAVLLDAPCSATGTLRRHPDILHHAEKSQLGDLLSLQASLLKQSAALVKPGGLLVYCTCSLLTVEGEAQVADFLSSHSNFVRQPIVAGEAGVPGSWLTGDGDLRTLPHFTVNEEPPVSGLDGFYTARLKRLN